MQADNPIRHMKHVFRVALLLILGLVAIFLGRTLFIPDTWGDLGGHFRAANVAEQQAKPVHHGGDASCRSCHAEQFDAHQNAEHVKVRCEVCHAPLSAHVSEGKKSAAMPMKRNRQLCLNCHRGLVARPKSFPQIQPRQHVDDNGGDWGDEVCFECHSPHEPL